MKVAGKGARRKLALLDSARLGSAPLEEESIGGAARRGSMWKSGLDVTRRKFSAVCG